MLKKHGGEIKTIEPAQGRVLPNKAGRPGGDYYHDVVVSNGKVYDETYPDGIPIDEYKALWGEDASAIKFGF